MSNRANRVALSASATTIFLSGKMFFWRDETLWEMITCLNVASALPCHFKVAAAGTRRNNLYYLERFPSSSAEFLSVLFILLVLSDISYSRDCQRQNSTEVIETYYQYLSGRGYNSTFSWNCPSFYFFTAFSSLSNQFYSNGSNITKTRRVFYLFDVC